MHRKIEVAFLVAILASLSVLLLPTTISTAATSTASAGSSAGTNGDTKVTYKFYDLFNGKMDPEVWGKAPEEGGTPWLGRWWWYGTDYVQSWTYPVIYQRGTPAWNMPYAPYDDAAYWTSGRLNVNATNLPLNINTVAWVDTYDAIGTGHRSFVPWNLTLGAIGSELTSGGYCNISWYMTYTNEERTNYWGWGLTRHPPAYDASNGADDGWLVELNGSLTLDKQGTMKVFGMNSTTYDHLNTMAAAWTAANNPAEKWWWWLDSEGNWWPMVMPYAYNWLLHEDVILGNNAYAKAKWLNETLPADWPWNLPGVTGIFDLSHWPTKVTVPIWIVGWMLECLVGRWLSDWWSCMGGFMPYEGYYEDFHLNASIGPSSTNLLLDTQVDWLLVASDGIGVPCSSPQWVFEPQWGDIPYATHTESGHQFPASGPAAINYTWSPGWHYYKNATGWIKTYKTTTVGAKGYGGYVPYGYTPSSWDLGIDRSINAPWLPSYDQRQYWKVWGPCSGPGNHSGWDEKLIFDWSNIQDKGKVVGFHQANWTTEPSYNVTEKWGNLVLNTTLSEPTASDFPGQISTTATTLTLNGPLNFANWSYNTYRASWDRLATNNGWPNCTGILPWGEPLVYWSLASDAICNPAVASTTTSKPVWTTNTNPYPTAPLYNIYGLTDTYKGIVVGINAIVRNRGTVPCNFTVTASIEKAGVWTSIGSIRVVNLHSEQTLVFPWNTSTYATCTVYRIKIEITNVSPAESYTQDDVYILQWTYFTPKNYPKLWYGPDWSCMSTTGGAVKVKIPGDIDDSGKVTWEDLSALGLAYGTKLGDKYWNPEADFDFSGKVTWEDLSTLGLNYGAHC